MQQPVRTSYARLAAAILVPLAVLLAVYYAANGDLSSMGGQNLRLTLEAPSDVTLTEDRTPVTLKLSLANRSGGSIQLSASDPCKVLRWVVQAAGDVFVQSRGSECTPEETSRVIASGETIERTETIQLDSRRFQPGVTYTVFVQLYGQSASAEFTTAR